MACGCNQKYPKVNSFKQPQPEEVCIYTLEELNNILTDLETNCAPKNAIGIVKSCIQHFPKCLFNYHVYIRDVILNFNSTC